MYSSDGEVEERLILEKLRLDLRARLRGEPLPAAPAAPPTPGGSADELALDLEVMEAGYDIYGVALRSHRPVVGAAVVAAKKLVRQLLMPVLERQVTYNAAVLRVVRALGAELGAFARGHRDELADLRREHAALRAELAALRGELEVREGPASPREG